MVLKVNLSPDTPVLYPFSTGDALLVLTQQTGADMMSTYKETFRAGFAVNVPEC